jgi:uncharacterized membrane protein YsdA (DUF1294 family)
MSRILVVVLVLYAAMSAVTFAVFALDKRAAKQGRWRTPEKTLLSLALCGGWPGALLAMKLVRHKTKTRKFAVGVPLIGGLHLAAWVAVGWWTMNHSA